jgi:hypothetical protein
MEKIESGEGEDDVEKCGVVGLGETAVTDFNTVSVYEIFDDTTFECLFCPQDLLKVEFYQKVGFLFGNLCEMFSEYIRNHYDITIPEFVYSFLVCDENKLRGGCGCERVNNKKERFKLYINPLYCAPTDDFTLTFTKIMNIANHEVCHVFLHCIDPIRYNVKNNYHGAEFFQIFSDIDEFFHDRRSLRESLWNSFI